MSHPAMGVSPWLWKPPHLVPAPPFVVSTPSPLDSARSSMPCKIRVTDCWRSTPYVPRLGRAGEGVDQTCGNHGITMVQPWVTPWDNPKKTDQLAKKWWINRKWRADQPQFQSDDWGMHCSNKWPHRPIGFHQMDLGIPWNLEWHGLKKPLHKGIKGVRGWLRGPLFLLI